MNSDRIEKIQAVTIYVLMGLIALVCVAWLVAIVGNAWRAL